jgi:hypothetical protein
MLALALKLILAHLIGDFLLQPDAWIKDKLDKKYKSKYLYYHIVVHLIALLIILRFEGSYWLGISLIIISHYIIDLAKLFLSNNKNTQWLFFTDQLFHLLVIAGVVYYYEPFNIDLDGLYSSKTILFSSSLILVTFVSSVIIKLIISKWNIDDLNKNESLADAGKYIGLIERLFVFIFIVMNYWSGIGFLLAAKSVFRFGDLSKAKDRKLTEYILIGTLLSFGLAIFFGSIYKYALALI